MVLSVLALLTGVVLSRRAGLVIATAGAARLVFARVETSPMYAITSDSEANHRR